MVPCGFPMVPCGFPMVAPRIFPMAVLCLLPMLAPRIFPMVPCGFPMVLCHGAAIRRSPAQLCGLPYGAVRLSDSALLLPDGSALPPPDAVFSHLPDGAPFAATSSLRHQPIVASAALPLPCRSPSAAASSSVPRSPALQQSLQRSAAASSSAHRSREAPFAILQLRPGQAAATSGPDMPEC